VAWTVSGQSPRFDTVQTTVFVANLTFEPKFRLSNTRAMAVLYGGGLSGWLGEEALLLNGKQKAATRDRDLMQLDLKTKNLKTFSSALNFRGLSVYGQNVLYYVAFDSQARNGLFSLNTRTGQKQKLPWFGSYRFRDASRVVFIPMQSSQTHVLFEWDLRTGKQRKLADLQSKVAGDDWQISPNGSSVVFVSGSRLNVVDLPK
jgi:hypothetical protein